MHVYLFRSQYSTRGISSKAFSSVGSTHKLLMYEWRHDRLGSCCRHWNGTREILRCTNYQEPHCRRRLSDRIAPNRRWIQKTSKHAPIKPNSPKILPNTSTMRILTNRLGSAASAIAAVEPVMPTQAPQRRLQAPTVSPPQKMANPGQGERR